MFAAEVDAYAKAGVFQNGTPSTDGTYDADVANGVVVRRHAGLAGDGRLTSDSAPRLGLRRGFPARRRAGGVPGGRARRSPTAEVAPHAEAWDRDHTFPVDAVRAMGELGLFGLVFPEAYGGSGAPFSTLCIAIEEIGRVDQSLGITLSAGVGLGANPIFTFGTEEQRQRWLPDLVAGRALGAFGLTEPDGGSDAGATRTKATLDEGAGEWVIDGRQGLHHQLGHADHVAGDGDGPHRPG